MMLSHTDADYRDYHRNAIKGSKRLRNAILKSMGHTVRRRRPRKSAAPLSLAPPKRRGRLKGQLIPRASRRLEIGAIQSATAIVCRIRLENLRGRRKKDKFVRPRQLAMWIAHMDIGASYSEIGRNFDRDHTTVIYSCGEIQKLVDASDRSTILRINAIRARLG